MTLEIQIVTLTVTCGVTIGEYKAAAVALVDVVDSVQNPEKFASVIGSS